MDQPEHCPTLVQVSAQQTRPARTPRDLIVTMLSLLGLGAGLAVSFDNARITDFPVDMIIYRDGVRAFLGGDELYSVPMRAGDLELPFIYPPFGALVLVPLTVFGWMDDYQAGVIMNLGSSLLILLCLYLVLRAVLRDVDPRTRLAVTAAAWPFAQLLEPVWLNASFAQINVVIMALVVLDLVPRRRWLPQGWLIGVAAAIKLSPLAMLLYFLLRRDFRAIFTAGVSFLLMTLAAAAIRWDATVEFFTSVLLGMGTGSEFGVDPSYTSNSSLKAMLMRWFPTEESLDANGLLLNIVWLVLALLVIILGGWLMVALMHRDMHIDAWLVNALIMLLISPVSWSHHWAWMALLLPVALWRWAGALGRPIFLGVVLSVWGLLMLTEPPKWWFGDGVDVHSLSLWQTFLVSDYVWLALLTMGALALALRRVPVAGTGHPDGGEKVAATTKIGTTTARPR